MPFSIVRQDITKMNVDAIVNAANTDLAMGGGVCGAIFEAAGPAKLQSACRPLAPIRTGEAVITPGFDLPARYVIHTAGPVYHGGNSGEEQLLYSSYKNSLSLAMQNQCESIAFPLISAGIYGYPKVEALQVATRAIQDFLRHFEMEIYLAVFDRQAFAISEELLRDVADYLEDHFEGEEPLSAGERKLLPVESAILYRSFTMEEKSQDLETLMDQLDLPFSEALLRMIDEKGMTDVEVYKKANIDRKLFSKIRAGKGYVPSKRTALALTIALEASVEEANRLLRTAGYALSPSQKSDVIIRYFLINRRYDIFAINEVLFTYDLPLLGV